jgi:hypothetical protein
MGMLVNGYGFFVKKLIRHYISGDFEQIRIEIYFFFGTKCNSSPIGRVGDALRTSKASGFLPDFQHRVHPWNSFTAHLQGIDLFGVESQ